jgi:hypothetical protein
VVYTLKCNITAEVNHLSEGLKIALQEDREKNSAALGARFFHPGTWLRGGQLEVPRRGHRTSCGCQLTAPFFFLR